MSRTEILFGATLMLITCSLAGATTITFNSLSGANGDSFTSVTEAGFTVTAIGGDWKEAHLFGATVPDIYNNIASGTVRITNGGLFTFDSVDLAGAGAIGSAGPGFTITGFLGMNVVLSFGGTAPAGVFQTFSSPGAALVFDRLEISMTQGIPFYSYDIDNISVNTVPEPTTMSLLGLGLVAGAYRKLKH